MIQNVSAKVALPVEMATFLIRNGFVPASLIGKSLGQMTQDEIMRLQPKAFGILLPELATDRSRSSCQQNRRMFLGIIWFAHPARVTNGSWLLDVYGRANLEKATELARKIDASFSVSTRVVIDKQNCESETLDSDCIKEYKAKPPVPKPAEPAPTTRRFSHELYEDYDS